MPHAARALALEHFRWIDGHADMWALFRDAETLAAVVDALAAPFRGARVTAVCGVESRGFLLGGAVAVALGVGFVPVRKGSGLFPGRKDARDTGPDYRGIRHRLRLQEAALGPHDRVLLVDDWIETGSQATAVRALVEARGSAWAGCSVVVDQLGGVRRRELAPVRSLLPADALPPSSS